jgi:hypothetical protein
MPMKKVASSNYEILLGFLKNTCMTIIKIHVWQLQKED